jgi:hypothetical protein
LGSGSKVEAGKASGTYNIFRSQVFGAGFVAATGGVAALSLWGAVAGMWQFARREVAVVAANAKA